MNSASSARSRRDIYRRSVEDAVSDETMEKQFVEGGRSLGGCCGCFFCGFCFKCGRWECVLNSLPVPRSRCIRYRLREGKDGVGLFVQFKK